MHVNRHHYAVWILKSNQEHEYFICREQTSFYTLQPPREKNVAMLIKVIEVCKFCSLCLEHFILHRYMYIHRQEHIRTGS